LLVQEFKAGSDCDSLRNSLHQRECHALPTMGWFDWFSSKPDPSSGAAPDRSQRQACWDARDAYYACLDKNFILKPGEEEKNICSREKKAYEGSCAKSWVSISTFIISPYLFHFKRSTTSTSDESCKRSKRTNSPWPNPRQTMRRSPKDNMRSPGCIFHLMCVILFPIFSFLKISIGIYQNSSLSSPLSHVQYIITVYKN